MGREVRTVFILFITQFSGARPYEGYAPVFLGAAGQRPPATRPDFG